MLESNYTKIERGEKGAIPNENIARYHHQSRVRIDD